MINTKFLKTMVDSSNIVSSNFSKDLAIFNLNKYVVDYTYDCCSVFTKTFPSYESVKVLIDNEIVSSDFSTHEDCMLFYNYAQCLKLIHFSLRDDCDSRKITDKFNPSIECLFKINEFINRSINQSCLCNADCCFASYYSKDVLLTFFNEHIVPFFSYKDRILGLLIVYLTLIKHKIFINNNDQISFIFLSALLANNGIPPFSIQREFGSEYYSLMYDFLLTDNADKILLFLLNQFKNSNC